jgi:RNA polymerase sigma-70 factor (ECF subfamily)
VATAAGVFDEAAGGEGAAEARARRVLSESYRDHGARMHAALVRRVHDFDLAEDALHEAMIGALESWRVDVPRDPPAWLVRAALNKAIDRIRRSRLDADKRGELAHEVDAEASVPESALLGDPFAEDDRLRLMFLCCHPALPFDARVALTLRAVSCLSTGEIARAFLVPEATMAQRIVRAKARVREAKLPFRTPEPDEMDERIDAVLAVVYLVFNEGYAATAGAELVREDLCVEALRLARLLVDLAPASGPAAGLRALLLLTDARRAARVDASGDLVLLEDQDRALWNRDATDRGLAEVARAIRLGPARHPYTLQAAIAGVHAQAARSADTDWAQIVGLYEMLLDVAPSSIVALNHAVAAAMIEGAEAGLGRLDALAEREAELEREHLFHAARADLLRKLARADEARVAYRRALELAANEAERRFLSRRLAELG